MTLTVVHEGAKGPVDLTMTRARIEVPSIMGDLRKQDDLRAWDFLIDKRDVPRRAAEPGRMILTFTVADLEQAERHLIDREVVWIREVEETSLGRIGTLVDPDGNYVQVMQLTGSQT